MVVRLFMRRYFTLVGNTLIASVASLSQEGYPSQLILWQSTASIEMHAANGFRI
jgi:hypothetical protein